MPTRSEVYINATQYFSPVPEAIWNYQIGDYQVCENGSKIEGSGA